nr:hypothetical protein [Tanacetum cinerariifolium]
MGHVGPAEYGISEALHPELPGLGDRIVDFPEDWRTNASKEGMSANGTYFVEDVRALDTHQMDLFSLIRAPNHTKVKTGSRPIEPLAVRESRKRGHEGIDAKTFDLQ